MLLTVVALALAQPLVISTSLVSDTLEALKTGSHPCIDNRIGFQFASLMIGSEDGEDSSIAGSHPRLTALAKVLIQHPEAHVLIEGHVGTSAPLEIAQSFSEQRAHIVAQILEEDYGVEANRIETRGWGARIAAAAQVSEHPNARAARAGFGWAELFVIAGTVIPGDPLVIPDRPDYYDAGASILAPPPPAPRAQPNSYPIFYMYPGTAVGEQVALHLFEPRYRLLARRMWAADKMFVYCARAPMSAAGRSSFNLPLDQEPEFDDGCVLVLVTHATFSDDGQADIIGHAVERLTLREVSLEPGTGGLFSTRLAGVGVEKLSSVMLVETMRGHGNDEEDTEEQEAAVVVAAVVPSEPRGHICQMFSLSVLLAASLLALCLSLCAKGRPANQLRFCPAPAPQPQLVSVPTHHALYMPPCPQHTVAQAPHRKGALAVALPPPPADRVAIFV